MCRLAICQKSKYFRQIERFKKNFVCRLTICLKLTTCAICRNVFLMTLMLFFNDVQWPHYWSKWTSEGLRAERAPSDPWPRGQRRFPLVAMFLTNCTNKWKSVDVDISWVDKPSSTNKLSKHHELTYCESTYCYPP